ncbi:hypothetical protein Tco_0713431, partial [Tanacetum coccineum]
LLTTLKKGRDLSAPPDRKRLRDATFPLRLSFFKPKGIFRYQKTPSPAKKVVLSSSPSAIWIW